jgi:dolichyl-phosphate-mannose-protein mannosyltransferase
MRSKPSEAPSATSILVVLAVARILLHTLANGHYGFHRDELATFDDAHYLAWGYVAYPPLTPFVARVALEIFGPWLPGLRFFAALSQGVAMVVSGLMARELGGRRWAQIVAGLAVAIAPVSLVAGSLFQYVAFDYLWWVAIAYFVIRLLKSQDPRWWLPIGTVIGMGMMTKYTMGFLVAGLAVGVLLTPARRLLANRWVWYGAALSLLIFVPNLIWQVKHDFISLDFLSYIHARDVRIGRTKGFLVEQLFVPANPATIPLWIAGLFYYFFAPDGKRYRAMGWMFVVPLAVFAVAQGRSYYMAPAYPMLLAAGAVLWEQRVASLSPAEGRSQRARTYGALAIGAVVGAAFTVPIAPVNSPWWKIGAKVGPDWREEIGWQELAETVAGIRNSLPAGDRARLGILAGNYGEAGAIDLYGPTLGLPKAISGTNSYWLRGYGDPPPQTLIVLGLSRGFVERNFDECALAGHTSNRYGVANEETSEHPDIFVCRRLRQPWPEFWKGFRHFG